MERLVGEYREWLVCERGLPPGTVRASEQFARRFLARRVCAADPCGVLEITAGEFFAFVIDVYSRRVLGWQLAGHMRTDLVLDALRMALSRRTRRR